MPTGPKGQKRPADVIGNAIRVARIATGEEAESPETIKDQAAAEMGRKGGKARAAALSGDERRQVAKNAARGRWGNKKP